MSRKKKILLVLLSLGVGAVIFVGSKLYWPAKGLLYKTCFTPKIIRKHEFVDLNYTFMPNKEKLTFYSIYTTGKGSYGLKRRVGTDDLTEFTKYLLTVDGQLTEIRDFTGDASGGREFEIRHPKKVLLHCFDRNEQLILVEDPNDERGQDLILSLKYDTPQYHSSF